MLDKLINVQVDDVHRYVRRVAMDPLLGSMYVEGLKARGEGDQILTLEPAKIRYGSYIHQHNNYALWDLGICKLIRLRLKTILVCKSISLVDLEDLNDTLSNMDTHAYG